MVTTRGKKISFSADSSDGEIDVEQPAKPAPKRRKTKKFDSTDEDTGFVPSSSSVKGKDKAAPDEKQLITRRSGKGGKLRDLMNMPIDIFTEVCSYLDPFDIRRLALTSKRLWDILMTKEARHIWKTALAAVPDLPECPTDLNEPQYVCLLYSSECYTIGCTSRGTKADWFHRVRFCTTCYETKMTNEWHLKFNQQGLDLDVKYGTLYNLLTYFDSYAVMRLARNYRRASSGRTGYMRKNEDRHYYLMALKKAAQEYEALPVEEAEKYLSLLRKERDYRIETGSAMLKWKYGQLASRADDIAAEKNARFESIKAKLIEMGWEEKDFPLWNKDFRDLVLKDQKLTPKIWQNIKSKLEPMLETSRADRLETERAEREVNRKMAITNFYRQVGRDILDLPSETPRLNSFLPEITGIYALPSVKLLIENDTETVTEQQWIEVAPEVRLIVLKSWRNSLKALVENTENGWKEDGGAALPNETDGQAQGEASLETETEEEVSGSILALRAKLSLVTLAFRCKGGYCGRMIWWFPDLIRHGANFHYLYSMEGVPKKFLPLQPEGRQLVKRLLEDLKLDPETVTTSDAVVNDQTQLNLLCTRCDQRVATYISFSALIEHYLDAQKWFDDVTDAVRTSPDTCYPSRAVNSELPKIVNDHDWISRDAPLVRRDDEATKEAVLKLQSEFRKEALTDPRYDIKGVGGDELEKNPWREVLRCCRLCPHRFAPRPCGTAKIEMHIRNRHDKEPDLETDTTLDVFYASNSCPC